MVKKVVQKKLVKKELSDKHILRIAKKHFLAHGFAGTRMQAIADDTGVNKALLFYYYKNKEGLLKKVFDEEAEKMIASAEQIADRPISVLDKIRLLIENDIDHMLKNPDMPLFIIREMARDPKLIQTFDPSERAEQIVAKIAAEIVQAQKKGIIKKGLHVEDIFINMGSLSMFPVMAKPFCMSKTAMSERQYTAWLQARKKTVPDFIIAAITT